MGINNIQYKETNRRVTPWFALLANHIPVGSHWSHTNCQRPEALQWRTVAEQSMVS